jgi:hypothetical protein
MNVNPDLDRALVGWLLVPAVEEGKACLRLAPEDRCYWAGVASGCPFSTIPTARILAGVAPWPAHHSGARPR